jgi:hypothetical protein
VAFGDVVVKVLIMPRYPPPLQLTSIISKTSVKPGIPMHVVEESTSAEESQERHSDAVGPEQDSQEEWQGMRVHW